MTQQMLFAPPTEETRVVGDEGFEVICPDCFQAAPLRSDYDPKGTGRYSGFDVGGCCEGNIVCNGCWCEFNWRTNEIHDWDNCPECKETDE